MAVVLAATSVWGCGTDAKGVGACREIEFSRCDNAGRCDLSSGQNNAACHRFAEGNCLHGLPGPEPTDNELRQCIQAIEAAAACAKRSGKETAAQDCDESLLDSAGDTAVCTVVEKPERVSACSFLETSGEDTTTIDTASTSASSDAGK